MERSQLADEVFGESSKAFAELSLSRASEETAGLRLLTKERVNQKYKRT